MTLNRSLGSPRYSPPLDCLKVGIRCIPRVPETLLYDFLKGLSLERSCLPRLPGPHLGDGLVNLILILPGHAPQPLLSLLFSFLTLGLDRAHD
jgi:hypothetical protein